jgi:phenylacetate-CoA ligase
MAETAKKMGLNPREMGIKRMVCAGEPLPEPSRQLIEELWGCEVYDHIGGTEPCAWGAMCKMRKGIHVMEPFFLLEILDVDTESKEVAEGEVGVAVVTPLGRKSFPMIRFNTKDLVRRGPDGCECGRTSMKIAEVVGRTDDLRKIRGVLFTPVSVEELLRGEFKEIGEFEILLKREGVMDEIALRYETLDALGEDASLDLQKRLAQRLKVKTNLTFKLQPEKPGELPRYDLKAKRFKDLR